MALYGVVSEEAPTVQFGTEETRAIKSRAPAQNIRQWRSRHGLTLGGIIVSLAFLVAFASLNLFLPHAVSRSWMMFACAAGGIWTQVLIVAKWYWDRRRGRRSESRLMQGQADMRTQLTLLRKEQIGLRAQVALLRAELHALLGMLPQGVINYADRRAVEVSVDAIQRFSATGTGGAEARGVAPVINIREGRGRQS
jgi:hypothetical protein